MVPYNSRINHEFAKIFWNTPHSSKDSYTFMEMCKCLGIVPKASYPFRVHLGQFDPLPSMLQASSAYLDVFFLKLELVIFHT